MLIPSGSVAKYISRESIRTQTWGQTVRNSGSCISSFLSYL